MKRKTLDSSYLSAFCLEVALFLHAGISISDGLHMLRDDDHDRKSKALLDGLLKAVEDGQLFSQAIEKAGVFPYYLLEMVVLAEKTGKLENTMRSLSEYYARQDRLAASIKNAVFYPVILVAVMVIVIGVIIVRVLPIFSSVFNQLGAQMSPFAISLMRFGQALSGASTVILIVLGLLLVLLLLCYAVRSVRASVLGFFRNAFGDKGLFKRIASARFAFAMAMAIESGINADDSIMMAARVTSDGKRSMKSAEACRQLLAEGAKLGDALMQSGIFMSKHSRLLSLAEQTGTLPEVMHTIAEKSEETIRDEIDSLIAKIEPTLVIATSVIVGVILLSVMLPLAGIMSAIV